MCYHHPVLSLQRTNTTTTTKKKNNTKKILFIFLTSITRVAFNSLQYDMRLDSLLFFTGKWSNVNEPNYFYSSFLYSFMTARIIKKIFSLWLCLDGLMIVNCNLLLNTKTISIPITYNNATRAMIYFNIW